MFFIFLFLGSLTAFFTPISNGPILGKTSAPVLQEGPAGICFGMSEKEYAAMNARLSKYPDFTGITRKPEKVGPGAVFGFNLVMNGKNTSWALEGSESEGYALYLDLNTDGDLSNDQPIRIQKVDGKFTYILRQEFVETVNGRPHKYPYVAHIAVTREIPSDKTEAVLSLRVQDRTMRTGDLKVDGRTVRFALSGTNGKYNDETNELYFDLDGDGKFDTETRYSLENFKVKEKYVNIGEKTYEYIVDRFGGSITLTPLQTRMPDRADLRPGNPAPDFEFTDLDGKKRRLSEMRGKIVLLDVWALWCGPCVAEAPKLSAAYKRMKDRGFEIVSLDKNDEVEILKKFIAKHEMNWIHTQTDEAFLNLYRIDRYPSYFLIDRSGRIISNTIRAGEEMYKQVDELLNDRPNRTADNEASTAVEPVGK